MVQLSATDIRGIVSFLGEVNELDGEEPFPSELLGGVAKLVPARNAFVTEYALPTRELVAASGWWSDDAICDACGEAAYDPDEACQYGRSHPITAYRRRTGSMSALSDSDFYSRRERLRHDVNVPTFHAYLGIVDAANVCVSRSSTHTAELWLEREKRDFSERDKLVLDVLRPHLAARRESARLRRLLADALAALASPERADAPAVLLVGSRGSVEFGSPAAFRLMGAYFGEIGTRLPEPLEEWRRRADSPASFSARLDGHRLVVDAIGLGRSALVLHEERANAVMLTAREWDVMRWVEAGKKNDEIAGLLWITPSTVKKHLEHVYAKLGVRTRTAALAQLRLRPATSSEGDPRETVAER